MKRNSANHRVYLCRSQLDGAKVSQIVPCDAVDESIEERGSFVVVTRSEIRKKLDQSARPRVKSPPKERNRPVSKFAFVCKECGYRSATPGALEKHSVVHRKRLFVCGFCLSTNRLSSKLRYHISKKHDSPFARIVTTNKSEEGGGAEVSIMYKHPTTKTE
eukprot:Lithocolla_globosa_v1_NODE_902_length_3109_cov_24.742960.p2 type:complete len:161 gc:universal NODE_902_length_3109_cov_24.742960:2239-1757(-)